MNGPEDPGLGPKESGAQVFWVSPDGYLQFLRVCHDLFQLEYFDDLVMSGTFAQVQKYWEDEFKPIP